MFDILWPAINLKETDVGLVVVTGTEFAFRQVAAAFGWATLHHEYEQANLFF